MCLCVYVCRVELVAVKISYNYIQLREERFIKNPIHIIQIFSILNNIFPCLPNEI